MAESEQREWAEMTGRGTDTMTSPPPPAAAAAAAPPVEAPAKGRGRRQKAPKAPKAPRASRARNTDSLLSLADGPTRQQLEQEAAAEFTAALAPSFELLRAAVPDAASPEDAYRKIEGKLDPLVRDRDAGIPAHPIYRGDALVYYQLRRHYGTPNPGGSFARSWFPHQSP